MKTTKRASRVPGTRTVVERSEHRVPWSNPLKGDEKKMAMAEVKTRRSGLFVGFRMKF